jgi:hypothetical protein
MIPFSRAMRIAMHPGAGATSCVGSKPHLLALQAAFALHAMPHPPQLSGSSVSSTH